MRPEKWREFPCILYIEGSQLVKATFCVTVTVGYLGNDRT